MDIQVNDNVVFMYYGDKFYGIVHSVDKLNNKAIVKRLENNNKEFKVKFITIIEVIRRGSVVYRSNI